MDYIEGKIMSVISWHHKIFGYNMMSIYDLLIDVSQNKIIKDGVLELIKSDVYIKDVNSCVNKMVAESRLIKRGQYITYPSMSIELDRYVDGERFEMAYKLQ